MFRADDVQGSSSRYRGSLYEFIPIPEIKPVRIRACAPRGNPHGANALLPTPCLGAFTQLPPDAATSDALLPHQPSDHRKSRRLQPSLDRNLDPADHLMRHASHKRRLPGNAMAQVPDRYPDMFGAAIVTKLGRQEGHLLGIAGLHLPDRQRLVTDFVLHFAHSP